MKVEAELLIVHANQVLTMAGSNECPRTGTGLGDLGIVADGAVAAADGVIIAVGPTAQVMDGVSSGPHGEVIDATGRILAPGFVDPHTHLIFAGSRAEEFEMRLAGATHQEGSHADRGIASTMQATRKASEEELQHLGHQRLNRMLAHGHLGAHSGARQP